MLDVFHNALLRGEQMLDVFHNALLRGEQRNTEAAANHLNH
ncbi:False CDS [Vibrio diabolicus]|nr:False CDS [Vibrio diabolicus]